MSTAFQHIAERRLLEVGNGGAAVEIFGGLAVVILSILGLVGLASESLTAIAGIVFGVAVLAQGATIATEYAGLFSRATGGAPAAAEFGGGMSIEVMAGGAAIVLGILALLGSASHALLPALVIAGGASLIATAGAIQRLHSVRLGAAEASDPGLQVMSAATSGAAGGQVLAGIAAIVLGIVALASLPAPASAAVGPGEWLSLTLVGLLVLGSSVMMSGGSLMGRLLQLFGQATSQQ